MTTVTQDNQQLVKTNGNGELKRLEQTQMVMQPAAMMNRAELTFFADMIDAADLIPYDKNVTKEKQKFRVMAKIVAGAAHLFDPISSQENMHVIQGRCVLSARGMAIKFRRSGKYDSRIEKLDSEGCVLAVLERSGDGSQWLLKGRVSFMKEHAEKAKLTETNKAMYDKWDEDMFYANALKRAVRRFAPECLDTVPLDYRLSKESAAAEKVQSAPAPQQIGTGISPEPDPSDAAELETYEDQPYQEAAQGSFLDTEEPTVDEELAHDTLMKELAESAETLLENKSAGDKAEIKKILKGRVIENMDEHTLREFIQELQAI